MTFTLQDDPEPVPVRLVGAPNSDNGVRGMLDLERATELFGAFSYERQIAADLKYADGTSEQLTFSGFRDNRPIGRGKSSQFNDCPQGILPRSQRFGSHPVE